MHHLTRLAVKRAPRGVYLFVLLSIFSIPSRAQQTASNAKPATISGRVSFSDGKESKPARGAAVTLMSNSGQGDNNKLFAKTVCDMEGRYTFANVGIGKYRIYPIAPAFVPDNQRNNLWYEGKSVSVSEGENVDGIDFNLMHGGVITGQVTDANGRPVIAQRINVYSFNESDAKKSSIVSQWEFETDDLGTYRVYGLAAGRYLVSVGEAQEDGSITIGRGNSFFARTFHPNARDFAQAKPVAVTTGGETTNVDIALSPPTKTFAATGRVIDADTNKPVANANILQGSILSDGKFSGGYGSDGAQSDEDGNFRIKGLVPGRHGLFASIGEPFGGEPSDFYSDATIFEINDADTSDLEIKVHRGATISGAIIIEGSSPPTAVAKIAQLNVFGWTVGDKSSTVPPHTDNTKVNADGSFQIKGVRPGKVRIRFGYPPVKGLTLVRVERGGISISDGIEVAPRETVNDVRLVVAYGAVVVRGQVTYINGTSPTGVFVSARLNRIGGAQTELFSQVDSRGQFSIEGVTIGDYEVVIEIYASEGFMLKTSAQAKQTVSIKDEGETKVSITLDLSKAAKPETKP